MECVLDRKKFYLNDIVYLAASLWRDAVWPGLPLYLRKGKIRIGAGCFSSRSPHPRI